MFEGGIAVLGFWLFLIVAVLKRPIGDAIAQVSAKGKGANLSALQHRVNFLESRLDEVNRELLEVKETNDFTVKLLEQKQLTTASK